MWIQHASNGNFWKDKYMYFMQINLISFQMAGILWSICSQNRAKVPTSLWILPLSYCRVSSLEEVRIIFFSQCTLLFQLGKIDSNHWGACQHCKWSWLIGLLKWLRLMDTVHAQQLNKYFFSVALSIVEFFYGIGLKVKPQSSASIFYVAISRNWVILHKYNFMVVLSFFIPQKD